MIGHRRSDGQVGTRGLESVLIGHPAGGDDGAIWSSVRVASLGRDSGRFRGDLLDLSALFHFDSVLGLEADGQRQANR